MKKGTYISVQEWMVTELRLKGNELLVYALIFGFSQDDESRFTGSQNYIASWLSSSKSTVKTILKNLSNRGLIKKFDIEKNNIRFCEYQACWVGQKLTRGGRPEIDPGGGSEIGPGGGSEIGPNNISLKPIGKPSVKSKPIKKFVPPTLNEVIEYFKLNNQAIDIAKKAFRHYELGDWHDAKGNKVKNWKQKVATNWFVDEKQKAKQTNLFNQQQTVSDYSLTEDGKNEQF